MDFNFTEEQQMLQHSLQRWLQEHYGFEERRAALSGVSDWRSNWHAFTQLGLLGAPLPAAYGGLDGGPVDVLAIMIEFGKALVMEPYVPSIVLVARTLARAGGHSLLPLLADASAIGAFAHTEHQGYDLASTALAARRERSHWRLDGRKTAVVGAPLATHLLISTRTEGSVGQRQGLSLFLVPVDTSGIRMNGFLGTDGRSAADVELDGVIAREDQLVGQLGGAAELIDLALDEGAAALCAEAAGMLSRMVEMTVEYTKNRKQFGVPIGSFQVLQHRMAEMFMAAEQVTSMAYYAAAKLGAPPADRNHAVSAAKAFAGRAARYVSQSALQIHGGMGMTTEMCIGDYFKRSTVLDAQFGNSEWHLARYAASLRFANH